MSEKIDVTDRAHAAGWALPEGWRVLAWLEPDDDQGDPRTKGDVYKCDVDEEDYDNPTRAFCKHCKGWIRKLDADSLAGVGPDADGREPEPGDWAERGTGIDCPGSDDRVHEPDEPVAVRWWRRDRWAFVGVLATVVDPSGRVWGQDSLWGTEAGDFPVDIDRETGKITTKYINPMTADYPLPELIDTALSEARGALAAHAEAAPVITAPPRAQVSGPSAPEPLPLGTVVSSAAVKDVGVAVRELARSRGWQPGETDADDAEAALAWLDEDVRDLGFTIVRDDDGVHVRQARDTE